MHGLSAAGGSSQTWAQIFTEEITEETMNPVDQEINTMPDTSAHPYAGMWQTADARVRHELLPSGRYVEARGNREAAYTGRYTVTGAHIDYLDDTGFTADGEFSDDVLYHGGMILHRRP